MREFILCQNCFRRKMQVVQVIRNGRTLKLECPSCGALDFQPVWGKPKSRMKLGSEHKDEELLRKQSRKVTLRSVTPKQRRIK